MSARHERLAAAVADGWVLEWQIDLMDRTGALLATTDADMDDVLVWGAEIDPVEWASADLTQRSAQLTVPMTDKRLLPMNRGDLLHPDSYHVVSVQCGVRTPAGAIEWFSQLSGVIEDVTVSASHGVAVARVEVVDPIKQLDSETTVPMVVAVDTPVHEVVERIARQVFPEGSVLVDIARSEYTMPATDIDTGENRLGLIDELLIGIGHELYSEDARVTSRPVPPTTATVPITPVPKFGGSDGIPIDAAERNWSRSSPQAIEVVAGSTREDASTNPPIRLVCYDTDPRSIGFHSGSKPTTLIRLELPFVRTTQQATEAGYAYLRRAGAGPALVTFRTVPNPAFHPNDLIELEVEELDVAGYFRVLDYQLPTMAESLMTVTARGDWDPRVGLGAAQGATLVPVPTFLDDYNRPDENIAGEVYTEFGWSWGLESNVAVQRYGGWCFARVDNPLESSNQFARATVHRLQASTQIGVMIRSTGQYDGYSALCHSDGRVEVARFDAGELTESLGDVTITGLAGKTIELRAVGTTITLLVDGVEELSVEDDQANGTYFGLNGYGSGTNPHPALDDLEAGVIA